ncbi:MAG: S8 family serine peptidase [Candidatus Edwardsbacteria bacterium]
MFNNTFVRRVGLLLIIVFSWYCSAFAQGGFLDKGTEFLLRPPLTNRNVRCVPGEVLVKFTPGTIVIPQGRSQVEITEIVTAPEVSALLQKVGVKMVKKVFPSFETGDTLQHLENGKEIVVPDLSQVLKLLLSDQTDIFEVIREFTKSKYVIYAEPNYIYRTHATPNDPAFPSQWWLEQSNDCDIDATQAWDVEVGNSGIKIGIFDSGISYYFSEMGGGLGAGYKVAGGWDWKDNNSDPLDESGILHGTKVAHRAAALTNNNDGGCGVAGGWQRWPGDWGCQLFAFRMFAQDEGPKASDAADAIAEAANPNGYGVHVLNNSWGDIGDAYTSSAILDAIYYAYCCGRVVVFSKGNEGVSNWNFPSDFNYWLPNCVISVGATDRNDVWYHSNYGKGIDLVAPSEEGTSFSAPLVSGLAGLILSKNLRDNNYTGVNLSPEDVERIIISSAEDKGSSGYDDYYGYGRINAGKALQFMQYPYQLSHCMAYGDASVIVSGPYGPVWRQLLYGIPGIPPGWYYVNIYEVRKNITYPYFFESVPFSWGRGGPASGTKGVSPYYGIPNCGVVVGSGTSTGCQLCTYVYYLLYNVAGEPVNAWFPCQPSQEVVFAYSILGIQPPPLSITVQNQLIDAGNKTDYGTVNVDGTNYNSPYSTLWAPGGSHTICAITAWDYGGATHYFCSWSDRGGQQHTVAPTGNTTYTAWYKKRPYLWGYYDGSYCYLKWKWGAALPPSFPNYHFDLYNWIPASTKGVPGEGGWACIYIGNDTSFVHQVGVNNSRDYKVEAVWYGQWLASNVIHADLPLPADPIVAYTTDSLATSFPNGKKIAVDSQGKTHIVFTSNDSVYYTYSEDKDLEEWSQPVSLGEGKYPAIALDTEDKPNVCFVKGRGLNFVRIASAIPPAQNFYQASAKVLEIGSPSFVINPKTNEAYLGWTEIGTDFSVCEIAPFNVSSPPVSLAPTPIDQGSVGEIRSPSLALSPSGNLLASWSKSGKVYYNDSQSGTIQLSAETANAIHPIVDAYGDRTSVVWVEETSSGIYEIRRKIKTPTGWSDAETISFPDSLNAEYPVVVGASQYLFSKNFGDGNYEINYLGEYDNGWLLCTQNVSNTPGNSRYVSACLRQTWPKPKLYILWTDEKTQSKAIVKTVKVLPKSIEPIPYTYLDSGQSEPSYVTVQREGYLHYGAQPEYTIDYHPTKLIYRLENLNPNKRYRLKVVYYHEGKDKWLELLMVDHIPYKMSKIPPKTKIEVEKWLPHACYKDGQIEVSIRKMKGDYAICAVIGLYEYEKKRGREEEPAGAAMMADAVIGHQSLVFSLGQSYPNPFSKATEIRYQIADDYTPPTPSQEGIMRNADSGERSAVSLKIYNIAGQLVKTLVNEYVGAGIYTCPWDGKDESGKQVSAGVYFYRLQAGDFTDTKKMILVR